LEFSGTHQLSVYTDDIKLVGDSINTLKENTETLLETSTDVDLEINAEKTKYVIMSRHPNSGQNRLKMWQNSNTWGRHQQIRMAFMMKSTVDQIQAMFTIIQYKIFFLPVS
jgi:hypothetical protein